MPDLYVVPDEPVVIPDCCVENQEDDDYAVISLHGTPRICCAHCLDDLFDAANVPQSRLNAMEHL